MNHREKLRRARLILVTDPRPNLPEKVEAAVRGGVDVVQFRDKHVAREEVLSLAWDLKAICERGGAIFTVNDDIELARLTVAPGVHLGQEDATTAEAKRLLGRDVILGRSAGTLEEALEAVREGADYLGVGSVYDTPTKPDGEVAGLDLLREVAGAELPIPWFAIGGVTLETAGEVAAAGAPGFAVVRALLDAEDPEAAARELRSHFSDAIG